MQPNWLSLAEMEVKEALRKLPADVRAAAGECVVTYESLAEARETEDDLPDDLLGLFEGFDRLDPPPVSPGEMPRIRLFLDSIRDFAEGDEDEFRHEVRITWLHELGHYLGWGEEEMERLGLA